MAFKYQFLIFTAGDHQIGAVRAALGDDLLRYDHSLVSQETFPDKGHGVRGVYRFETDRIVDDRVRTRLSHGGSANMEGYTQVFIPEPKISPFDGLG